MRLTSIRKAPHEARRILRTRFRALLPFAEPFDRSPRPTPVGGDEDLLDRFLAANVQISFSPDDARRVFEETAAKGDVLDMTFDDIVEKGWVSLCWRRANAARDLRRLVDTLSAGPLRNVLDCFVGQYGEPTTDPVVPNQLEAVEDGAASEGAQPVRLVSACASPSWVFARLWERLPHKDPSVRLEQWADRWEIARWPWFTPSNVWHKEELERFRTAVFAALESERFLEDWDNERKRYANALAVMNGRTDSASLLASIPPPPATWVDRWQWLDRREFEYTAHFWDVREPLLNLARLLLEDVVRETEVPGPHPVFAKLTELAESRPALQELIEQACYRSPVLLADLLLIPQTAPWAAVLITRAAGPSFAWDRDELDRYHRHGIREAFGDAASSISELASPASEVAALLRWLHSKESRFIFTHTPAFDRDFRKQFWYECNPIPVSLADDLLSLEIDSVSEDEFTLETPAYRSALDILANWPGATPSSASEGARNALVDAYVRSVSSSEWYSDPVFADADGIVALGLAARGSDAWERLLNPIDFSQETKTTFRAEGEARYSHTRFLSWRLRTHIRMLSRLIARWPGSVPADAISAWEKSISTGTYANLERGKVAAFTADHERHPLGDSPGRPLALDIGLALQRVAPDDQNRIAVLLATIDEPMTLSQLSTFVPRHVRPVIISALQNMDPSTSGDVHTWTAIQARVEALIDAGAFEAAQRFLEFEREAKTLGPVPGRELARFHTELRLAALQSDRASLLAKELPSGFARDESRTAAELLDFYRASVEMEAAEGDVAKAEEVFRRLQRSHPDSIAYAVNVHAAATQRLLRLEPIRLDNPDKEAEARQILEEGERLVRRAGIGADAPASAVYHANRARLYLALGEPATSFAELNLLRPPLSFDANVLAIGVVALVELDRPAEARARLDHAIELHGETNPIIQQARDYVRSQTPPHFTSMAADIDFVARIQSALAALPSLPPEDQVRAVDTRKDASLAMFVIDVVKDASTALLQLSPTQYYANPETEDDGKRRLEDNISALFQRLIEFQVARLGWSVGDQSRGGFTAAGNAGERDLVLRKPPATEIAVIEAIRGTDNPANDGMARKLTNHFQKLFAYAPVCELRFNVVYDLIGEPASFEDKLREIAKEHALEDFPFLESTPLPAPLAAAMRGFVSVHDSKNGHIQVAHVVLDLMQKDLRAAAKEAENAQKAQKKETPGCMAGSGSS